MPFKLDPNIYSRTLATEQQSMEGLANAFQGMMDRKRQEEALSQAKLEADAREKATQFRDPNRIRIQQEMGQELAPEQQAILGVQQQQQQQQQAYKDQVLEDAYQRDLGLQGAKSEDARRLETTKASLKSKNDLKLASFKASQDMRKLEFEIKKSKNLTGGDAVKQENVLRSEYQKKSKEFDGVNRAFQRISDSGVDPSGAGDMALIFNYMKMLDPGSTVREGEFATAQNAAAVPDVLRAKFNKVMDGQFLSPVQRKDFLDRAGKLYKGQVGIQKSVNKSFNKIIKNQGLNSENILVGTTPFVEQPEKTAVKTYATTEEALARRDELLRKAGR